MGSLDKSMVILKRLGDPPYEFSLAELASFAGIGKSGAFKILRTLQKHNFVIQDFVTKKYHLSPIMIRLGNVYGRLKGIEEITKPVLSYISRSLGETTYITVWEGDRAFPAYKNVVRGGCYDSTDFIGRSIPLNSGGTAMVLCAYQEPEAIRKILESTELEKRTPFTIMDRDLLLEEYRKIREQGHAVEDETFTLGEISLAVPLFDKNNMVLSSLGISAPKHHLPEEKIPEWLRVLKKSAAEITFSFRFRS